MPSKISERLRVAVMTWLVLAVSFPSAGWAQTAAAREAARSHLRKGAQQLRSGDYADALTSFERAYQSVPSPKIFFNFGLAYQGLARYADALESFQRFVNEATDAAPENLGQAREQIRELGARVARLSIASNLADADILVDGRARGKTPLTQPLALDPGPHQVVLEAQARTVTRSIRAEAGRTVDLTMNFETPVAASPVVVTPPPAPTTSPALQVETPAVPAAPAATPFYKRGWFWVATGAVVGGTAALLLFGRRTEYPERTLGVREVTP